MLRDTFRQSVSQRLLGVSATQMRSHQCGCGKSSSLAGKCSECTKKQSPHQQWMSQSVKETIASPIIHEVLRSPAITLQPKLKLGSSSDRYEQEADRIADTVMQLKSPATALSEGSHPRLDTLDTPQIQQRSTSTVHRADTQPMVENVLSSPGRPLPTTTRKMMESRLGHDFSQVRVHTNAEAQASAAALNAQAYTVGHDLVFAAGQFNPSSFSGQHLLSHELTHVVQQSTASSAAHHTIQRKDPLSSSSTQRQDVVLLMASDLEAEAAVLAPGGIILKIKSLDDMIKQLKGVGVPVKTLFIISHSLPTGDIGFGTSGSTKYVMPSELAQRLQGVFTAENAPELIDFRGCSIGSSPQAMNLIREAAGAKAAIGGNCFNVTKAVGPIILSGDEGDEEITKASQITPDDQEALETGLQMLVDSLGDAKDCVLDRSAAAYFRAGGKLVAQWFSPTLSGEWDQRKSKCYKELTPETVDPAKAKEGEFDPGIAGHCRLIRVEGSTTSRPKAPKTESDQ